jgi:hypothetical protein
MAVDEEDNPEAGTDDAVSSFHARARQLMDEDREVLDALDE